MRGDRRSRARRLRVVEVIPVTDHDPTPQQQRSTADVARLFDIAGGEDEALALLDGCVCRLREVQAAKEALTALPAEQLRAALEYRRRALSGGELA